MCAAPSGVRERTIRLAIAEPTDQLRAELGRFGITEKIGSDNVYDSLDAALDAFKGATGSGRRDT